MAGWLKNETAFPGCLSNETKTEPGSHTSALGVGDATSSLSAQSGWCAADPSERQITILPPVVNSLPAGLLLHAGIQTSRFIIFIYFIYLFIFGARRQTRLRVDLMCLAAAGGGRGCACLSVRGAAWLTLVIAAQ